MTDPEAWALVAQLVSPMTKREYAVAHGRNGAIRKTCEAFGLTAHLPAPPPLSEDLTLQYLEERARARPKATRRSAPRSPGWDGATRQSRPGCRPS